MTQQQELQLRRAAKARRYSTDKIEQFIQFAKTKETGLGAQPAAVAQSSGPGKNLLKTAAKDTFKTLLVKPGARAGQLLTFGIGALTGNERLKDAAFRETNVDLGAFGSYDIEAPGTGTEGYKQAALDAGKAGVELFGGKLASKGVSVAGRVIRRGTQTVAGTC